MRQAKLFSHDNLQPCPSSGFTFSAASHEAGAFFWRCHALVPGAVLAASVFVVPPALLFGHPSVPGSVLRAIFVPVQQFCARAKDRSRLS